jgi:chemotaxis methyl-accepting protein methylase
MPRAAIAMGGTDLILDPVAIGQHLSDLMHSGDDWVQGNLPEPEEMNVSSALVLLTHNSGIDFSQYKPSTLKRQLLRRMALRQMDTMEEYLQLLASDRNESSALVQNLLVTVTSFFRDPAFWMGFLEQGAGPAGLRRDGGPFTVWSAACSTGQEAYSVAMLATELLGPGAADRLEILGTDISGEVVARARDAFFTQFEVQRGLQARALVTHFTQEGARWRLRPALRAMVRFEERNLLSDCAALGRFDVIFCRKVLIYFDAPTKTRVLEMLARQLAPQGVLYLGAAETVIGLTDRLAPIPDQRGVYGLPPRKAAA